MLVPERGEPTMKTGAGAIRNGGIADRFIVRREDRCSKGYLVP
jgi:hypothetical protein